MTEQEMRAIVRDVLARRAATTAAPDPAARHPSHAMFVVPAGADQDGPCVIEPAVPCTHCGYCKSLGH